MVDHPARAEEYRTRAAAETSAGEAAALDQVRMKHERAAQVWTDLADAEDAREADRNLRRPTLAAAEMTPDADEEGGVEADHQGEPASAQAADQNASA